MVNDEREHKEKGKESRGFGRGFGKFVLWPYVVAYSLFAGGHGINGLHALYTANNTNDSNIKALARGYADREFRRAYTTSFALIFDKFEDRPYSTPEGLIVIDRNSEDISRGRQLLQEKRAHKDH